MLELCPSQGQLESTGHLLTPPTIFLTEFSSARSRRKQSATSAREIEKPNGGKCPIRTRNFVVLSPLPRASNLQPALRNVNLQIYWVDSVIAATRR